MKRSLQHNFVYFLLILLAGTIGDIYGADQSVIRGRIGLKLFRTILAADTRIQTKQDMDGQLNLAIIYKNNQSQAVVYTENLQNSGKGKNQGKIKAIPILVRTIAVDTLDLLTAHPYAGIYIAEELDNSTLQKLVQYGIDHQIIIYSPFSGAVEQGVSAGLIIEARVKPYVNLHTLKSSQLDIKSFFLKVSKHYEP